MNHLYVNIGEINDDSYGVKNDDRRLTAEFYSDK